MNRVSKTLSLIIGLTIVYIFSTGIVMLFANILFENSDQYKSIVLSLGQFSALIVLYMFSRKGKNIAYKYKFKKINWKDTLYIVLFAFALSLMPIDFLVELFPSYKEINNFIYSQTNSILNIICIVVLIPIYEEILFRGVIFNHLKENYKIGIAIILQALLFAIAHGNIVQGIYAFIIGIALVLMYMYFNSIYSNIILHMSFNLFGVLIIESSLSQNKFMYYMLTVICLVFLIFSSYKMISNYRRNHKKLNMLTVK